MICTETYGVASILQLFPHPPPHETIIICFREISIENILRRLAASIFGPYVKRYVPPGLNYLVRHASSVTSDAQSFLANFSPKHNWAEIREEYSDLKLDLERRIQSIEKMPFPEDFSVGSESRKLIYHLVRYLRPRVTVETGVANGFSTFFILKALEANGSGELHSFDIRNDVGALIRDIDQQQWNLHIMDGTRPPDTVEAFRLLDEIDLFLHDSYHSFEQQYAEYEAALGKLSPHGLLTSDDIDKSFAFVDFCADHGAAPTLLVDTIKIFGAAKMADLRPS